MASEAQILANRRNAQLSRGPVTPAGKEAVSRNALKFALTGKTVLLPEDDIAEYQKFVAIIFERFHPETEPEKLVIQTIADTEWRLRRIPMIESGIFCLGRMENEHTFDHIEPCPEKNVIIDSAIYHTYQLTLANLTLQQSRLQRQLERRTAEFKELRKERELIQTAYNNMVMASIMGSGARPLAAVGTEFSYEFLKARVEFVHYAPGADVAVFDRAWRDKKAKTPA